MIKKKPVKKKTTRKRATKRKAEPRPYVMPKTAAELGITCKCGAPCIWFDYKLGEKEFYSGLVCNAHRVSNRVERLAQPKEIAAVASDSTS